MGQFWADQIRGQCTICYHNIHESFSNQGVCKECIICDK
jgi:hypothetical protein